MQVTSSGSINYQRSAEPQITQIDGLSLSILVYLFVCLCAVLFRITGKKVISKEVHFCSRHLVG